MKQNEQVFRNELNHAIDFDKVLSQFASKASFSLSRHGIEQALPSQDLFSIKEQLDLVRDAIEFFRTGSTLSLQGCSDIEESVQKAEKQMTLQPSELAAISLFLSTCHRTINALHDTDLSKLKEYADSMERIHDLQTAIDSCIDLSGSIKEDASAELVHCRNQLMDVRKALNERTRDFIKKHSSSLMESLTTSIQGRVCVLVKAGDKNAFGGMIHGQSQSGLAFYVEPSSFVTFNNQIQMTLSKIEAEKARICQDLSLRVKKRSQALLANLETMTLLDMAFAKAKWCLEKDGVVPQIQKRDHTLILENAGHPLIDPKKVVRNTYRLQNEQKALMITGPNMGGKTVTLKTIGLFVALAHAGFPVAAHRALIPYYDSMWFTIGDQQSIENDLSTFSSHIASLAKICAESDQHSFVLLDEIGNGTDPQEGSALAIAILDHLIQKGCTVLTSTHFNALKSYGKTNPAILVASMQFDETTLKATYRYIPGVSGASYAFSIARQYHLDASILEKAQAVKEANKDRNSQELEKLERLQNEVEQEKERFDQLIQKAHQLQKEAAQEKEKWEKMKKRFDQEYDSRLESLLQEKEAQMETLYEEMRQTQTIKPHQRAKYLRDMDALRFHQEEGDEKESFSVGDYVQIESLSTHGEIVELRKKEATVLANGMKLKVKTNGLKKIKRPKIQAVSQVKKEHTDKTFSSVPLELNIIGYRVEEGLRALDHYLDQCVAHHVKQVRIIHGMGTGRLRSAVLADLKKHPAVKSTASGGPSEGGLGATIVELK